jgi:hypothetical protein
MRLDLRCAWSPRKSMRRRRRQVAPGVPTAGRFPPARLRPAPRGRRLRPAPRLLELPQHTAFLSRLPPERGPRHDRSAGAGLSRRRAGLAAASRPGCQADAGVVHLVPHAAGLHAVPLAARRVPRQPARPGLRCATRAACEPGDLPRLSPLGPAARRVTSVLRTRIGRRRGYRCRGTGTPASVRAIRHAVTVVAEPARFVIALFDVADETHRPRQRRLPLGGNVVAARSGARGVHRAIMNVRLGRHMAGAALRLAAVVLGMAARTRRRREEHAACRIVTARALESAVAHVIEGYRSRARLLAHAERHLEQRGARRLVAGRFVAARTRQLAARVVVTRCAGGGRQRGGGTMLRARAMTFAARDGFV